MDRSLNLVDHIEMNGFLLQLTHLHVGDNKAPEELQAMMEMPRFFAEAEYCGSTSRLQLTVRGNGNSVFGALNALSLDLKDQIALLRNSKPL